MGIGFLGLFFVSPGVTYAGLLTPLILIGLGLGGTYPCLTGLALGKLNATQAGLAGSIVSVTMYLTATISTAINGTLYIHVVFYHLSKELNTISSSLINEASTIMENLIANRPLHQTLSHVPKQAHAKIASAIQTAVTHGFNDTALLSAVFCFIGMGVTYCFIKNTQGNT